MPMLILRRGQDALDKRFDPSLSTNNPSLSTNNPGHGVLVA